MIRIAFCLSTVSTSICTGLLSHPILFILVCFVAYGLSSIHPFTDSDAKIKRYAQLFLVGLIAAFLFLPASSIIRWSTNKLYGEEFVQEEFVRLDNTVSYRRGKSDAHEAYQKIKECEQKWKDMRTSGLCVESKKDFERKSYRLICADGWSGSSCGCGGGRGCCSWHGGYGYCAEYTQIETKHWIDGLDLETRSSPGLVRLNECGGNCASLRIDYKHLVHKAKESINPNFGTVQSSDYEWLVGWRDSSRSYTDFDKIVMKEKTFPPDEDIK